VSYKIVRGNEVCLNCPVPFLQRTELMTSTAKRGRSVWKGCLPRLARLSGVFCFIKTLCWLKRVFCFRKAEISILFFLN